MTTEVGKSDEVDQEVQEPTREEVAETIWKMSNHHATGEDRIPAEVFKYGGPVVRCV